MGSAGMPSLGKWCEAVPYLEKALTMRPYDAREGVVKAALGLELLQTQARCGRGLKAGLVMEVTGWLGGHAEGMEELEQVVAMDEFAHGKKAAARARMLALAGQRTGEVGVGVLDVLADFAWADGEREKAWEYLRRVRVIRRKTLEEKSYFLYERQFQMGRNLAKAMQWGDPDAGLLVELKKVVRLWPEWKLTEDLEEIRRMGR